MFIHRASVIALSASLFMIAGCKWIRTRSDFERDPFVMNHLTQPNRYSSVAQDDEHDPEPVEVASQSSSLSKKQNDRLRAPSLGESNNSESVLSEASDATVEGRLHKISQRGNAGKEWWLQMKATNPSDASPAELRIANQERLSLAREGDRVKLQGKLIRDERGEPVYEIASVVFLDERETR